MRRIILGIGLCISLIQAQNINFEAFGFTLGQKLDIKNKDLRAYSNNTQKDRGFKVTKKPIGNLNDFSISIDALDRIYYIVGEADDVNEAKCTAQAKELAKYLKKKFNAGKWVGREWQINQGRKKIIVWCQSGNWRKKTYHMQYVLQDLRIQNSLNSILNQYIKKQPKNIKQYNGL